MAKKYRTYTIEFKKQLGQQYHELRITQLESKVGQLTMELELAKKGGVYG